MALCTASRPDLGYGRGFFCHLCPHLDLNCPLPALLWETHTPCFRSALKPPLCCMKQLIPAPLAIGLNLRAVQAFLPALLYRKSSQTHCITIGLGQNWHNPRCISVSAGSLGQPPPLSLHRSYNKVQRATCLCFCYKQAGTEAGAVLPPLLTKDRDFLQSQIEVATGIFICPLTLFLQHSCNYKIVAKSSQPEQAPSYQSTDPTERVHSGEKLTWL